MNQQQVAERLVENVCQQLTHALRSPLSIISGLFSDFHAGRVLSSADYQDAAEATERIKLSLQLLGEAYHRPSKLIAIGEFEPLYKVSSNYSEMIDEGFYRTLIDIATAYLKFKNLKNVINVELSTKHISVCDMPELNPEKLMINKLSKNQHTLETILLDYLFLVSSNNNWQAFALTHNQQTIGFIFNSISND